MDVTVLIQPRLQQENLVKDLFPSLLLHQHHVVQHTDTYSQFVLHFVDYQSYFTFMNKYQNTILVIQKQEYQTYKLSLEARPSIRRSKSLPTTLNEHQVIVETCQKAVDDYQLNQSAISSCTTSLLMRFINMVNKVPDDEFAQTLELLLLFKD